MSFCGVYKFYHNLPCLSNEYFAKWKIPSGGIAVQYIRLDQYLLHSPAFILILGKGLRGWCRLRFRHGEARSSPETSRT